MPCVLEVNPPIGAESTIFPGEAFTTFRVCEMPYDSREEERQCLFARKMYRTIAPWVTKNSIYFGIDY